MAEVKRDAGALSLGEFLFTPAGLFGGKLQDVAHARDIVGSSTTAFAALGGGSVGATGWHAVGRAKQFEPQLERITTRGVSKLVDEAMNNPGEHAASWRAPWAHRPARVDHRLVGLVGG